MSAFLIAALGALLIAAAPAGAAPADEVSAGRTVAGQLQAGTVGCSTLTATQFERLGEFVMERMVGSRAGHEAMNERMTQALGAENADRMHELLGRSYAGCAGGNATSVPMGPAMMGATGSGGGWGAMMSSPAWRWMHDGAGQQMSAGAWRDLAANMMGSRYSAHHHGWSAAGVVAAVLGALVAGVLVALLLRRPWRHRPPGAPSTV
jgi:hypothetical protein